MSLPKWMTEVPPAEQEELLRLEAQLTTILKWFLMGMVLLAPLLVLAAVLELTLAWQAILS